MTAIIDSGCIVVEQAGVSLKETAVGAGLTPEKEWGRASSQHKGQWTSSSTSGVRPTWFRIFVALTPANKSCDSLRRSGTDIFGLPHFYCDSTTKLLDPGHHNRKRRQSREEVVTTGALILGFYEYIIRPGTP
jgi:hypothetical protein